MPPARIKLNQETLVAAIGDGWPQAQVDAAIEALNAKDGKFPSGSRRLPADLVAAIQRERLIAAMLMATSELSYREMNVQDVLDRAGVSRPTFYEHFANKEDCFLAAFDSAAARLRTRIEAAVENADGWRERLRSGLEELLRFASVEPDAARVLIVEARAASADAVLRRDAMLDYFSHCIETQVCELLPDGSPGPSMAAAGIVGGVEALLYSRLGKGQISDLDALLPSLMYFVVLSYEGHEAAGDELETVAG